MPQLDTIYTLMTYLWTWLTLYLITQKIKTFLITTQPKGMCMGKNMNPTLSWL